MYLTSDIPERELNVLVLDVLDVEANRRHRGDDFAQLHAKAESGLASVVEAKKKNLVVCWEGKAEKKRGNRSKQSK